MYAKHSTRNTEENCHCDFLYRPKGSTRTNFNTNFSSVTGLEKQILLMNFEEDIYILLISFITITVFLVSSSYHLIMNHDILWNRSKWVKIIRCNETCVAINCAYNIYKEIWNILGINNNIYILIVIVVYVHIYWIVNLLSLKILLQYLHIGCFKQSLPRQQGLKRGLKSGRRAREERNWGWINVHE